MSDKSKALAVLSVIEKQTAKAKNIEKVAAKLAAALEQAQGEFWRTCGGGPVRDDLFEKYMSKISDLWNEAGREMCKKWEAAAQELVKKCDALTFGLDDWGAPLDGVKDLSVAEWDSGVDWGALTDWDSLTDWGNNDV